MKTIRKKSAESNAPMSASNETIESTLVPLVAGLPALTAAEHRQRAQLEETFKAAFRAALEILLLEAVPPLREFKQRKLYRHTHHSWRDYCLMDLGMSERAVDYPFAYREVYLDLKNRNTCSSLPIHRSQLRPLLGLQRSERIEVWKHALNASGPKQPPVSLVRRLAAAHSRPDQSMPQGIQKALSLGSGIESQSQLSPMEQAILLLAAACLLAELFDRFDGHERRRATVRMALAAYAQVALSQEGRYLPRPMLDLLASVLPDSTPSADQQASSTRTR